MSRLSRDVRHPRDTSSRRLLRRLMRPPELTSTGLRSRDLRPVMRAVPFSCPGPRSTLAEPMLEVVAGTRTRGRRPRVAGIDRGTSPKMGAEDAELLRRLFVLCLLRVGGIKQMANLLENKLKKVKIFCKYLCYVNMENLWSFNRVLSNLDTD